MCITIIKLSVLVLIFGNQVNYLVSGSIAEKDVTYTPREQEALKAFKLRVQPFLKLDYMNTDFYLIRWLRAKNLNLVQAETMLLQHLRWRQQNQIDTVQQEDWRDMESDYPYQMDTHDLKGQPVGTIDIYDWDVRRIVLEGKTPRLMRYLFRLLEYITGQVYEAQERGNRNVTRFLVLGNADGFNLVQHACTLCLPAWIQFVRAFEGQYPGFLENIIVIESPSTVNVVLDLIRPLLSAETQNALKIFGHSREKWMAYLDGIISRDQRRANYGGTKSD